MLKEILFISAIFAVCSLTASIAMLFSPTVGVLSSGILGYILYLVLGRF